MACADFKVKQPFMLSYSLQVIVFSIIVLWFQIRRRHIDVYVVAAIMTWAIVTSFIFFRYRQDQVLFYSNDQLWHKTLIYEYLGNGLHFNLSEIMNSRYVITLPAFIASKFGLDPILAIKMIQLVFLLSIYNEGRRFIERHNVEFRLWQTIFFVGPTSIFISTLALRDLVIVFFTMQIFLSSSINHKLLGTVIVFLLRPHLVVAIIIGWILSRIISRRPKRLSLSILLGSSVLAYVVGTSSYSIGANIQNGTPLQMPVEVFTQFKFVRMFANFVGLQFLTFGETVVHFSATQLLLTRIIFIDTFLISIIFLLLVFRRNGQIDDVMVHVLLSFLVFFGLISQSDWNSSRQNLPFLTVMGLLSVVDMMRLKQRARNQHLEFADHSSS